MISDRYFFEGKAAKLMALGITPPGYAPPEDEEQITVGGTDWWHILNLEPYGCRRRLWYEKSGVEPDAEEETTKPMERGLWLEPVVAKYFEEVTGLKVRRRNVRPRKGAPEWLGGHIDRHIVATTDTDGPGVLEIKTMGEWAYKRFRQEGMTLGYVAQIQHYLLLTSWKWGMLAVMEPSSWDLYVGYVKVDYDLQQQMIREARGFVSSVKLAHEPDRVADSPQTKPCRSCPFRRRCWGQELEAERSTDEDTDVEVDESAELAKAVEDYLAAKDARDEAEALYEEAKERLQSLLGRREAVKAANGAVIEYKWNKPPKRFDSKAFRSDHPDLYAKYVREFEESRSRRLRVIL